MVWSASWDGGVAPTAAGNSKVPLSCPVHHPHSTRPHSSHEAKQSKTKARDYHWLICLCICLPSFRLCLFMLNGSSWRALQSGFAGGWIFVCQSNESKLFRRGPDALLVWRSSVRWFDPSGGVTSTVYMDVPTIVSEWKAHDGCNFRKIKK